LYAVSSPDAGIGPLAGTRITVPYTGSHKRIGVYGAATEDGRQMFCTCPRFDGRTFRGSSGP